MSAIHFSEFIANVKRINPRFRERTSSLRRFIEALRKAQHNPRPQGPEAINHIAALLADARVEKYLPALENLLTVWGRGLKSYPAGSHLSTVEMNRICFRGDNRPPDEIFPIGFQSRQDGAMEYRNHRIVATNIQNPVDPEIMPIDGVKKAGDIKPVTAVCVTNDMDAGALFPLPSRHDPFERIYIYVVFVENGAHTHTTSIGCVRRHSRNATPRSTRYASSSSSVRQLNIHLVWTRNGN